MNISIFSGAAAVVWQLVCAIQPLFNVFFQNYLGATAGQLGLLVTIIQLTGLFQIVGIVLYGKIGRQKPIFIIGHIVHRALTAVIAFVAFYVARGGSQERGIVIIIIAMSISWIFANASSACWFGWIADLFPESMRGQFFMRRSAIIQVVNIAWFFIASTLLDLFPKERSMVVFGVLISVGAVAGLLDILSQVVTPEIVPETKPEFDISTVMEPLKNPDFVKYAIAIGLAIFAMNMVGPFQAPYVVDPARIGAPNTWLGIMSMLTQFIWVITAPFWGTIMDRWGRKPVVISGTLLVLGWIGYIFLSRGNYFIVLPIIALATGILAPAFWEGSTQMMLSLAPEKNRISYIAWYLGIVGLFSAPGSLAGGILNDALSGVTIDVGPFLFTNFHIVQGLSIFLCCLCALLVARVKEGAEKPFGFVVSQLANPQIIRTFQYLGSLNKADSARTNTEILRNFHGSSAELALTDIIDKLDDPDSSVQEEAARALGRIPCKQSVDALMLTLLNKNSDARIQAARSLGKIGDKKAVGALVGCLWEPNEELQKACIEALADIGDEESTHHIMKFLRESQTERMKHISSAAAARMGEAEAARDIIPGLLSTRHSTSRKQYAIALASLLGQKDDFYQYISGSPTVLQGRHKKLLARFSLNMQEVYARQQKKKKLKTDVIENIRREVEADQNVLALKEMIAFSKRLTDDIFGKDVQKDFLFRIDQKLGIFAWMLEEAEKHLALNATEVSNEGLNETARIVTLLAIYFLSEY